MHERGGALLVLALVALLALAGGLAWWYASQPKSPEDAAALRLHAAVLERAGDEGLFGYVLGEPPDIWSTGEACGALAAYGDPGDHAFIRRMVDYTVETRLAEPMEGIDAPHGGWPIDPGDTIGAGEPTGWVCASVGLAWLRLGDDVLDAAQEARALLLALQNPDGSFSSVLSGPEAARTSATQDALLAMLIHAAVARSDDAELLAAIERAAGWFGETYDPKARVWYPRVRHGWKSQATVPGCSETTVWLLLNARELLLEAGRKLPAKAEAALDSFAQGFRSDHRDKLATAMPAERHDYQFDLPEGYVTTWGKFGHRWSWLPYRALCVARLASAAGTPRKREWQEEEAWLREQLGPFSMELGKLPTFQVSETLFMLSILRNRPVDHPKRGSLIDLIRSAQGR
jgi:hypothetical protein